MQEVLAAKTTTNNIKFEYHELGYSVDTGIEFITKEIEGKTYLISVNSDKNPVEVTISGLNKYKTAKVLTENRTTLIRTGQFTDEYKPFDVHIYKLN